MFQGLNITDSLSSTSPLEHIRSSSLQHISYQEAGGKAQLRKTWRHLLDPSTGAGAYCISKRAEDKGSESDVGKRTKRDNVDPHNSIFSRASGDIQKVISN